MLPQMDDGADLHARPSAPLGIKQQSALIPRPAIELAPMQLLLNSAPLLEMERCVAGDADVPDLAHPAVFHGA